MTIASLIEPYASDPVQLLALCAWGDEHSEQIRLHIQFKFLRAR